MAGVRTRDAAAFEALYDAYSRLVYGVALRMLGDAASAEDVTQGVFLKLWTAPESFSSGNFTGWLVRVTRNRVLDLMRSKSRSDEEIPADMPDTRMLEDDAFSRIDAEIVRKALTELPGDQRELIELGFFGGITHEEMSRRTGVPLGTVKTRIRTGLRRLRVSLNGVVS